MDPVRGSVEIEFAGERLLLLPDRALFWITRSALVIADLHLGKAATFRSAGLPVPSGTSAKDLNRLDVLLDLTGAEQLLILGDFLHAKAGRGHVVEAVTAWRKKRAALPVTLVRGNHDHGCGACPAEWNFKEASEPHNAGALALSHFPDCESDQPLLAGHVHPVFALTDYDGSVASAACFVVEPRCLILPAFGSFTGGHKMHRRAERRIFLTTGRSVVEVPRE